MNSDRDAFLEHYLSCKVYESNYSLNDFQLFRKVGEGAFSKVYKAKSLASNTDFPEIVAIKMISKKIGNRFIELCNVKKCNFVI